MAMSWVWLLIAIVFEASWVIGLRFIQGWTKLIPSIFVVATYTLGLVPLSLAGKAIPPSVLYAVWVGGGIVTVFLADTFYFGEPVSIPKVLCIFLILTGAVGLKLITAGH
jgi:quaternary ammonium compound-resistance protein SugE